jgi:hypothetical protein
MPQVRYLAVARIADKAPVAAHAFADAADLAPALLDGKLARVLSSGRVNEHGRLTITDKDVGSIHYDSDPACLYLAVTAKEYPQRLAFKLLSELRGEFEAAYGDEFNSARAGGLTKKTRAMFGAIAAKYEDAGGKDKITSVSMQVDEVKGAMQNNINAVLKNQENLETLLESSSNMRTDASAFQRSAVQAKNRFWWQNIRLMIAIAVLLGVLVIVIVVPIVAKGRGARG